MGSKSSVLRENPSSGAQFVVYQNVGSGLTQAIVLCDTNGDEWGVSGSELHVAGSVLDSIRTAVELIDNAISGSEMQVDLVTGPTGASALQIQGTAADGAAATGNPLQIGGKDGSGDIQALLTDTAGRLAVDANLQVGDSDVGESNPVPVANALTSQGTFTIGSGADGSAVTPVDLGANYKVLIIRCEDCDNIQASTTISLQVGEGASDTVCDVYEVDDAGTKWESGNMPTTAVTWRLVVTQAFAARRVRIIMSNTASGGDVVFYIAGSDRLI